MNTASKIMKKTSNLHIRRTYSLLTNREERKRRAKRRRIWVYLHRDAPLVEV